MKRVLAAVTAALLVGMIAMAANAAEVRVLNWQGYGTDEPWALELFEAKTGYKVVHDNFNSEQEMLTKLRTSPGAYDVVLINSAFTGQAAEESLIQAIDPSSPGGGSSGPRPSLSGTSGCASWSPSSAACAPA